eukprot:4592485-Amphidinium_carterae.1
MTTQLELLAAPTRAWHEEQTGIPYAEKLLVYLLTASTPLEDMLIAKTKYMEDLTFALMHEFSSHTVGIVSKKPLYSRANN